ncbi:lipocalin/fatty-acid binding family protein [Streptomyces virginiae]|uniref:lipocalin/fatty-acid binding family protein n=1 Tax=Streptomyces virginiae TaxID=1961 RepID=UPI0033277B03
MGKFRLISSENYDKFLKELGVGVVKRTAFKASTPVEEFSADGDGTYTLRTAALRTTAVEFRLGEEFEEDRQDGVRVKTVMIRDGHKLVQKQFGEKEVDIVREFFEAGLTVTLTVNGVSSRRVFERL